LAHVQPSRRSATTQPNVKNRHAQAEHQPAWAWCDLCLMQGSHTMKIAIALIVGLPIAAEIITTVMHTVLAPIMRVLGN
jgi:hypothetical protein